MASTGIGCLREFEVVIVGGGGKAKRPVVVTKLRENDYDVIREEPWRLSKDELRNYNAPFYAAQRTTPKEVFDSRESGDMMETVQELVLRGDSYVIDDGVLGKGQDVGMRPLEGHYFLKAVKAGEPIKMYAISDGCGAVLPGAKIYPSKRSARGHNSGRFLSSTEFLEVEVYADEMVTDLGPPEFIYYPRNVDIAYDRIQKARP